MGTGYLALTEADREAMLRAIGVGSIEELFADIPAQVRLGRELALEPAASELEVERELGELAARNVDTGKRALLPRRRHLRPLRAGDRRGRRLAA